MPHRESEVDVSVPVAAASRTMSEGIMWTVGRTGVPRTGGSSLEDDELVVCDAMFGAAGTSLPFLLDENFSLSFNLPYGGIDSVAMSLVERMVRKGIVEIAQHGEAPDAAFVSLTSQGRTAWEMERRPVWDAYCSDSRSKREGVLTLKIRAIRAEIVDAYLKDWIRATGGLLGTVPTVKREEGGNFPFWRTGPFFTAELTLGEDAARTDYAILTRSRIWWRTVTELLESHRALKGHSALPALFGS